MRRGGMGVDMYPTMYPVAEKPILFSPEMVLAILSGKKTQTRRILKLPKGASWGMLYDGEVVFDRDMGTIPCDELVSPYGRKMDRLWVRERHAYVPASAYRCSDGVVQTVCPDDPDLAAIYAAGFDRCRGSIKWRPSIFMPRWASRICLEVTGIWAERLRDISPEDAVAEGAASREEYFRLWEKLNGPLNGENPFVWVVSFQVLNSNAR